MKARLLILLGCLLIPAAMGSPASAARRLDDRMRKQVAPIEEIDPRLDAPP